VGGSLGVAAFYRLERSAYGRITGPLFEMPPTGGVLQSASSSVGERFNQPFSRLNHAAPLQARSLEQRSPVSAPVDPLTPPVTDGLREVGHAHPMAPQGIPSVLALEVESGWTAAVAQGSPRVDPEDGR